MPIPVEELETRFTYHPPKEGQPEIYKTLRAKAFDLALTIRNLTPESREQSLAITHLEQTIMWANAAEARRRE